MAITMVTVHGDFDRPDSATVAPQGSVQFTAADVVTDDVTSVPPIPIVAQLDAAGGFSVELAAVGTDTRYKVVESITGAPQRSYTISLSDQVTDVNLASLTPVSTQPPAATYVSSVDGQSGVVDLSATYVASTDGVNFTWDGEPVSLGGGGSGSGLPATVVSKTADYTAAVGDLVEADATTADVTVTLPAAPAAGSLVTVKRVDASGNTVTVVPGGTGTIDGDASAMVVSQWAGAVFEHVGADAWLVTAVLSYGDGTADATATTKGVIKLAGDLAGTADLPALAASGVTAGQYGDATHVPQVTVDAKGRVTDVTEVAVSGGGGGTAAYPHQAILDPFLSPLSNTGWDLGVNNSTYLDGGLASSSGAVGDQMTWEVLMAAGTWQMQILGATVLDAGIATINIDGVAVGTIDMYSAGTVKNTHLVAAGIAVAADGLHTVQVIMTGKNAASSNNKGYAIRFNLLRTGA